jgi:uncharacterized membrane protein
LKGLALQPTTNLVLGCVLFVGSHLLLSHPLRRPIAAKVGEQRFMLIYSIVALLTFVLTVRAYQAMPAEALLWFAGASIWGVATTVMLAASILMVGSLIGNPALPAPGAEAAAAALPRGVFAITRHPMMWSFALWGVAHILVMPTPGQIILASAMILLALLGSWGQDGKKAKLMGPAWQGWAARSAFMPFAGQLSGRISWRDAIPRPFALIGGLVLWLLATWVHGALGYSPAGIWLWL